MLTRVKSKVWLGSLVVILAFFALQPVAAHAEAAWTEWGGPGRDFKVEAQPLAMNWPEDGPRELWRRSLGHGNSGIVVEDGVAYTMYRDDETEYVIALDAATGKTLWSYKEAAPLWEGFRTDHGSGPHTTPILYGDQLCTAGVAAKVFCLNKKTGEKLWVRDLWQEFGAKPSGRGYASSPIIHGEHLIVPAGGEGHGLVAFKLKTGEVAWSALDFKNGFSSPIQIQIGGKEQIVSLMAEEVIGVDPETGSLLWSHGHQTKYNVNAITPVWAEDNILFVSSAYDAGSRALRLTAEGDKTQVEELWYSRSMQVHHATVVRMGELVVGSSGDFGPAFVTGVDAETGEVRFKERGFAKANIIAAGDTLILLDEDGKLGLATVGEDGLKVHATAEVLTSRAWSSPTLVGTTLYARDWKEIVALDLGEQTSKSEKASAP